MADARLSVVIHGHFYQPPRDDPWLETIEAQPSAWPFHDWNERITKECYRAVVAARKPGPGGRIASIVNTLESMSFNFGPTLLEWMEKEAPSVYQDILDADAASAIHNDGQGNAIAQAYHHTILPLASRREKVTEVRWGMADFRKRFRRDPVGMWLPETAVDDETLDVLAQEGIGYTILAPHQVVEAPPNGLPGVYRTRAGRSIALFVYDAPLSHGVAFGPLLEDAETWAEEIIGAGKTAKDPLSGEGPLQGGVTHPRSLVSIATDGETYGHHHRFGEMALASVLGLLRQNPGIRIENFSSYLARTPPEFEVELLEPSSWSCVHGVERWRSNCGCGMNPSSDTQQEWRKGLRDAVDWLASRIHQIFEVEGAPLLGDVWAERDRYGARQGAVDGSTRARELLELERHALRLFTSCGWFFDDLAGIETRQILRYAARALDLSGPRQSELEAGFLARLEAAVSNESPPRTGRAVFIQEAKPPTPAHFRVAAGAALWNVVTSPGEGVRRAEGGFADSDPAELARNLPEGAEGDRKPPAIPGYAVSVTGPGRMTVTHRRTGRRWELETRATRPLQGEGAIGVRLAGTRDRFVGVALSDLPEAFRDPITRALLRSEADPARSLLEAVRQLDQLRDASGPALDRQVQRILELVNLLLILELPIPFDAQTAYFKALNQAPQELASRIMVLREPLGFTPKP